MSCTSFVTSDTMDPGAVDPAERQAQRTAFQTQGYVVLRRLLTPAAVERHTLTLERLSGRSRASLSSVETAIQRWRGLHPSWTRPGGLSEHPALWDLIFHPRLLGTARAVLGNGIRYLPHSELHVGFSTVAWHRDNVDHTCGEGPDWNETHEPYRLARVVVYLQSFAESRFSLGLLPGTHRASLALPGRRAVEREIRGMADESTFGVTPSALSDRADWIGAESGDAVLFDPRLIHSGSHLSGPKYSVYLAYGVPGTHFRRHAAYQAAGGGYDRNLPPPLLARLRQEGLHSWESFRLSAPIWTRASSGCAPSSPPAER